MLIGHSFCLLYLVQRAGIVVFAVKKRVFRASLFAGTLRVIAHPARMQMLIRLAEQERPVAWLAEDASIQPHAASSHLRLMQRQGVVKGIRRGKFACYRIIDPNVRALVRSLQPWLGK